MVTMKLCNYIFVIFLTGYCRAFDYTSDFSGGLNEGDACDQVDGVTWRCEEILNCDKAFFKTVTSETELCNLDEFLYCCPPRGSLPSSSSPKITPPSKLPKPTEPKSVEWTTNSPKVTLPSKPTATVTKTIATTSSSPLDAEYLPKPKPTEPKSVEWTSNPPESVSPIGTSNVLEETSNVQINTKSMRISEKKCVEYAKYVKIYKCGIQEKPLIFHGTKAGDMEFPHQALLGYGTLDKPLWLCGGILISEYFIMTAHHCLSDAIAGPAKFALLGETNVDDYFSSSIMPLKKSYLYNGVRRPAPYNDIALFRTEREVKFNQFVRPACLHTPDSPFPLIGPKESVIATGWGLTEHNKTSKDLLKVKLKIIDRNLCDTFFKFLNSIGVHNETQICAGDLFGGRDACSGDSGGPLQAVLKEPYCMYTIVGVTSQGIYRGCGTNRATIFTRVSYYVPWIESIVWPGY